MCRVRCPGLASQWDVGPYLPEARSYSEQLPETLESHPSLTGQIFNVFLGLSTQ